MSAWYVFATLVVFVAIFLGVARLLLPQLSEYKTDISVAISDYIGQPVRVQGLNAEWHGFGPSLVLENVALLNVEGGKPVIELEKTRLDFNLIKSLIFLQPELSNITLVGADLVLARNKDGRISVAGMKGQLEEPEQTEDLDTITEWIFSQGRLRLEKSNITWRDRMGGKREMQFSSIDASLKNSGSRHVLDASVSLPRALGKSFNAHIDLRGDLLDAQGRDVKAYFRGEKLKLTEFLESQSIADISAEVGEADFQLWLRWKDGAIQKLEGDIDVDHVSLFPASTPKSAPAERSPDSSRTDFRRIAGKFKWLNKENGWQFDSDELALVRNDYRWLPARVSISVQNGSDSLHSIDAYASHMQLEDVTQVLGLFSFGDEFLKPLVAISPRGMVHDARLVWQSDNDTAYQAYARLDRATTNAWKFIPAIKNVYGQLWLEKNRGQAVLEKGEVKLNFPNLFRWPIDIDEMRGQIDWTAQGDSWSVFSHDLVAKNKDISSSASFGIAKDGANKPPFISLAAHFKDGDGSQVARYLPTGIMPGKTVEWLDSAIAGGHVVSGGTIMHGRLSDFPFDAGKGKFEVRFDVEGGRLDYAKDWPSISDIDAEVQFLGRSMFINARKGKILSNVIKKARVEIPNMTGMPMPLLVYGEVGGTTQDKLNYIIQSPKLNESFGKYLVGMETEGESLLSLDLVLPIGDYGNTSLKGHVDLENESLAIPAVGRILSNVKGRLHFREDGLEMDADHAELLGQPTDLRILTSKSSQDNWISIQASGSFDARKIASTRVPSLENSVSGNGELEVLFDIPLGKKANKGQSAKLDIAINLQGVGMSLPPPFNKKAEDVSMLNMKVDFPPESDPVMHVSYGELMQGAFRLNKDVTAGIESGEVRVNGGVATLPENPGLRVVGWLESLKLNDWLDLWPGNGESPIDYKASLSFFHSIDIAIGKLEAYGQEVHNASVVAIPEENSWRLDIKSDELVGLARIPSGLSVNPVKGQFKQIFLSEPTMAGGGLDPRDLPSLDLTVDDFRYESRKLGRFRLETTRVANGVRMEQAILNPRATKIIARGGWYINGEKHATNIQAHVQSTDVGKSLKELGYVGAVEGGEGEVNLNLEWPGALYDVEVSELEGNMQMSLKNGQLLEIDPGAGRLFGMLSLQTLPRRLFLDFSDVFSKGFGFDQIDGKFNIEKGNAYTDKLKLDGPAAKIEIKGRVGLANQDYDQLVTVTPRVSESLPVIGALTSTPQVGAVILFIQKIFQPGIEEATKFQYTIKGKWNDPVIKKIKSSKPENLPDEENL